MLKQFDLKPGHPLSRRRFVQGLAAGGAAAALDWRGWPAWAQAQPLTPPILAGTHFGLTIDALPVNFTGQRAIATAINGSVPGPTLRWREGDTVSIAVTNRMKVMTSIHWHGMRVPSPMDGVPGLSFAGIAPGQTFNYRFPVKQNGTFWYHSHSGFQEQTGLSGALIVEPNFKDAIAYDREYVVMLTDWTDTDPETVFANMKKDSEYYNFHQRTMGTFFSDVRTHGLGATLANRWTWGTMNMTPTDISDVTGSTYTYLLNGNAPKTNWTGLFRPNERLRLRFINGSADTFFDVRIPGLPMTVVAADGNDIESVPVDEFRMGVAETYDVMVQPTSDAAYTIFAQSEDRTGFARGTLAPRLGMAAAIPPMDPRPLRTMVDMGMGNMAGMAGMKGMAGMVGNQPSGTPPSTAGKTQGMAGMDMSGGMAGMPGMPGGGGNQPPGPPSSTAGMDMGGMPDMGGMEMGNAAGTIPFPQPGPNTTPLMRPPGATAPAKLQSSNPVHLHLGPEVDMIPMEVTERLNDPGDGLNGNGRRVLTYADLRARYRGVDPRPPAREIELHLTGNMERFIWGFNGEKFSASQPIAMKLGERLRVVMINDTMMEHPIHLHGLWSELENGHGAHAPYKHTIIVKPSERVSYLLSADTPGKWALHCHLIYHMEAGMFRTVVVS